MINAELTRSHGEAALLAVRRRAHSTCSVAERFVATCLIRGSLLQLGLYDTEVLKVATISIRLDQGLIEKATIMAKALSRTPPKQIEHWAKIGEIMEDNPDLPYEFVKQAIIAEAEREAGKLESYNFG